MITNTSHCPGHAWTDRFYSVEDRCDVKCVLHQVAVMKGTIDGCATQHMSTNEDQSVSSTAWL